MTRRTLALGLWLAAGAARASATFVIVPTDPAGQGFNDPTSAAPVGGNPGTTLGAQRLAVFQEAGRLWGAALDSPVPIVVRASFQPLTCSDTEGVLGAALPTTLYTADRAGADGGLPASVLPHPDLLYVAAEADRFARRDLSGAQAGTTEAADIEARFNASLDTAGCLGGIGWYYGFDAKHGKQQDLLEVVLHEFGHGLGFLSNDDSGTYPLDTPDLWSQFLLDVPTGRHWRDLSPTARNASATSGALVWDGPSVRGAVPATLRAAPVLRVDAAPAGSSLDARNPLGPAQFGASLTAAGVSGVVRVAAPDDACTASGALAPLTGAVALVQRGTCEFVEKARNAQAAGAVAVLIVNNVAGLNTPGGADASVTIPVAAVAQDVGAALADAASRGDVRVTLLRDATSGYEGADAQARAFLYAPATFDPGSSVSHWDRSATPNLLMEPAINADLAHSLDLTLPLFRDIDWFQVDLSVSATGDARLTPGRDGTFTFTVTNPGPSTALAVTLAVTASAGLTLGANAGDCTTAFPCALGDVPPGATRTVRATVRASGAEPVSATATVTSPSDFGAANDTARVDASPGANPGAPDAATGGCGVVPVRPGAATSGLWPALAVLALLARRGRPRERPEGAPGPGRGPPR